MGALADDSEADQRSRGGLTAEILGPGRTRRPSEIRKRSRLPKNRAETSIRTATRPTACASSRSQSRMRVP